MAIFGFFILVILGLIVSGYACALWWMTIVSQQISAKSVLTMGIAASLVSIVAGILFWVAAIFAPFQIIF